MKELLTLRCRDACGAQLQGDQPTEVELAQDHGWTWLGVAGGYRCGACWRALDAASRLDGVPPPDTFVDPLPPTSIGALSKVTAESITPPVVPR